MLLAAVTLAAIPAPSAFAQEKITIQGSDTLLKMAALEAAAFMEKRPGKIIQVTGGGSGTGIAAIINGAVDIANASRPMKPREQKMASARGYEVFETPVALDGIAIFANRANPVRSLTLAQARGIFTGRINNWRQVGGLDTPITRYSRENNSGTYLYFKEQALAKENFAPDCQNLPGTASVVNAVSRDHRAIGFGGLPYGEGVKILELEGITPSPETIASGRYPISRRLYQYTLGRPRGLAREFILFELTAEGQALAARAGYVPLPEAERMQSAAALE